MKLSSQEMKRVLEDVRGHSEVNFNLCFQCRTCANACPFLDAMDIHPNVIMRMLQFGMGEPVLKSSTIWVCVGCNTCCDSCPMAIDIPTVMDALRQLAMEKGVAIGEPDILNFHEQMLKSVKKYGRAHKLEIMMRYKLKKKDLFQDIGLGLTMLAKRKLDLRAKKVKDIQSIESIFKK
ncbi:4Fe-4S dicluster domain-containing protein [Desulfosediminicola ganghwensis]|uniref:4Fe-4S dicluster domain-containing protein n=1 Tax=Desulfosediminicola ganghwensis TaxID=2569540 RepID=UPI0010ABF736|nr:4Fe-4S dicluster domain-containing protein [Desulfosediminicola ganghwensis]